MMRRLLILILPLLVGLVAPRPVLAHPAPFSYLDLRLNSSGVAGSLVVHDFDVARELGIEAVYVLLDADAVARYRDRLLAVLSPRVTINLEGAEAPLMWGVIEALPERQSLKIAFTLNGSPPAHLRVRARLFPYDPVHQTFVNVYENEALTHQAILDASRETAEFYAGTTQGRLTVVRTFVLSGIEHILIGPDHVLFLVGLLLLRGSFARLALIVTAFTLGHSATLSLAALDIVSPPSRLVEPLIALTIIVVGVDNLIVLKARADSREATKDIRAWLAAGFGLIHGFGFAAVLKEFGLPPSALGFSLLAFNVGVEVGQMAIVAVVALALEAFARRNLAGAGSLARAGSIGVILAGAYWFIQRTFFPGGSS